MFLQASGRTSSFTLRRKYTVAVLSLRLEWLCDFPPCGTPAPQETLKTVCAVLIPRKTQLLPMPEHQQRFSWDFGRAVRTVSHGVPLQA
ncbi:hypothetical protein [Prevotella nigrescens]|uniref:hypothetical protein n=1 Tax=Prevotella nigrescens TaxID=28133 RepID=UPI0012DCEFDC|nr:hypothetical protein [Prevotella nigrescens]QUB55291.1 hypothetical protein J4865_11375 [Prevotella nigrescens F0103]